MAKKEKKEESNPDVPKYEDTVPAYEDTTPVNQPKAEGPSMAESALGGFGAGASLGFLPQIGGALGAASEALRGNTTVGGFPLVPGGQGSQSLSDLYKEYKDLNQQRNQQLSQANPWSYSAGYVPGLVAGTTGATGLAAKGATAAGALAPGAAQEAATFMNVMNKTQPLVKPAATGAAISGLIAKGQGEDVPEAMAQGAIAGPAVEAAIPAAAGAIKSTAQGAKKLGSAAVEMATGGYGSEAFQRGLTGEWLVGKKAAKDVVDELLQMGQKVPEQLEQQLDSLAQQKLAIIRSAQENGVRIDPADIDNFMARNLNVSSPSSLANVQREMAELREVLQTAKSGPEVQQVVRRYFGQGNTEKGEFANLFSQKQAEQQALQAQEPQVPLTQKQQFEQEFAQRQAEQKATQAATLQNPQQPENLELTYEPMEGSDNVLGVIRQRQYDTDGNFTGYKSVKTQVISPDAPPVQLPKLEMLLQPTDVPGKSLGIIRQAVLDDQGNVTGYKKIASKLLTDDEAAMWKDMSETVRSGTTATGEKVDLTEPEQLYQLYKDLKAKSEYGDTSFKSVDAKKATSDAIEDIQQLLRKSMNELEPTDAKISALKEAQEVINAQDKDPESVMKTFASLLGKTEDSTISGADARNKLANLVNKIKIADPVLGQQIESQAHNLAAKYAISDAAQGKVYLPRPLATPQAFVVKGANVLGYGIGQVTPEWMQSTAGQLMQKGGQAGKMLANVLSKAADKDPQTRTAIMFGLMQQPAYRDALKEYLPQAQEQTAAPRKAPDRYREQ